jgi:GNAT superfamily N-acetyltransferase
MSLTYEKVQRHHLPFLYELRFAAAGHPIKAQHLPALERDNLLDDIRQDGGWICKSDGVYIGYCLGIFSPNPRVDGPYIRPEYLGQGAGTALLEQVTGWFFGLGATSIMLTAPPQAVPFFERKGWFTAGSDLYGDSMLILTHMAYGARQPVS